MTTLGVVILLVRFQSALPPQDKNPSLPSHCIVGIGDVCDLGGGIELHMSVDLGCCGGHGGGLEESLEVLYVCATMCLGSSLGQHEPEEGARRSRAAAHWPPRAGAACLRSQRALASSSDATRAKVMPPCSEDTR